MAQEVSHPPSTRRRDYTYKHKLQYPSYLTPEKLFWTIKEGDIFEKDGVVYRVTQVIRSPIAGVKHKIVLTKQ